MLWTFQNVCTMATFRLKPFKLHERKTIEGTVQTSADFEEEFTKNNQNFKGYVKSDTKSHY